MTQKPTPEEQELLVDLLLNADGVKVFLRELDRQAVMLEHDLVRLSLLDKEDDVRRLLRAKYEAQGARKLYVNFRNFLEQIRLAASKAEVPTDENDTHHVMETYGRKRRS